MPSFKVLDPVSGQALTLEGDSPPTEQELEQIFQGTRPSSAVQDRTSTFQELPGAFFGVPEETKARAQAQVQASDFLNTPEGRQKLHDVQAKYRYANQMAESPEARDKLAQSEQAEMSALGLETVGLNEPVNLPKLTKPEQRTLFGTGRGAEAAGAVQRAVTGIAEGFLSPEGAGMFAPGATGKIIGKAFLAQMAKSVPEEVGTAAGAYSAGDTKTGDESLINAAVTAGMIAVPHFLSRETRPSLEDVFGKDGASAIRDAVKEVGRGRVPSTAGIETETPQVFFPTVRPTQAYVPPEPGPMTPIPRPLPRRVVLGPRRIPSPIERTETYAAPQGQVEENYQAELSRVPPGTDVQPNAPEVREEAGGSSGGGRDLVRGGAVEPAQVAQEAANQAGVLVQLPETVPEWTKKGLAQTDKPEQVIGTANLMESGRVQLGDNANTIHALIAEHELRRDPQYGEVNDTITQTGFLTNKGRFINPEQAAQLSGLPWDRLGAEHLTKTGNLSKANVELQKQFDAEDAARRQAKPPEPPAQEPAPPPQPRTEGGTAPTPIGVPVEVQPKPSEAVSGGPAAPEPVAGGAPTRLEPKSPEEWEKLGVKYARRPDGTLKTKGEYTSDEWKAYTNSVIESKLKELPPETGPEVAQEPKWGAEAGIRRGNVGDMLESGEQVLTSSGRTTTPFPKLNLKTGRGTSMTVKKVDAWLRENAIAEAESRGDHFNAGSFKAENPKSIPPASKASMEEYLFGQQPEVPRPLLKEVKPVEPTSAQVVDKAKTEIQSVAKTEGQRPAKEVKSELVSRIEKAIEDAKPLKDVVGKEPLRVAYGVDVKGKTLYSDTTLGEHMYETVYRNGKDVPKYSKEIQDALEVHGKKITIEIPGDGTFRIWNTKEALTEVLERAKKIPTTSGTPQKITYRGMSAEDKRWLEEQKAAQQPAQGLTPEQAQRIAEAKGGTFREQAESLAQSLEKAKVDLGGGQLHAFGVVPDLWNRAVGVVQAAIRAGGSLADAIEAGIKYIRDNFKGAWDEAGARNALGNITQPKRRARQVMGVRQGPEQEVENIARQKDAIQEHLFSGDAPISPETTANAWSMAEELSGENKGQHTATIGSIVRDATGMESSDMAPALVQVELRNYALKLAAKGDRSLMDYLVKKRMGVIDPEAALDPTQLGRGLRALAESMGPFWKNVLRITADREKAAGRALGTGKELFNKLMDTVESLTVSPDEFKKATDTVKTPKGKTMDDLLGPEFNPESEAQTPAEAAHEKSNFQREAERIMAQEEQKAYGAEWLKPEAKLSVRKIINEFLATKPPVGMPTSFEGTFKHELMSRIMADPLNVSRPVAYRIASAVFDNLQARMITRQQRLMERAATPNRYGEYGKLTNLIEQMLMTPYRTQHDSAWRKETAANWFMSRGLSRDHAEAAAQLFSKQFETALQQAAEREARRLLERTVEPKHLGDVIKALRLGLTDPRRHWADDIAAREGFKPLTAEQQKRVADLELKSQDEALSPAETKDVLEQMMRIFRHTGGKMNDEIARRWSESFVAKFLSGIRTFTIQFEPIIAAIRDFSHLAMSDPRHVPQLFTAMKDAYLKTLVPEFRFAWKKRAYGFHIDEIERDHNALQTWWEKLQKEYQTTTSLPRKAWIRTRQIEASHHFVSHFLNSIDQAMMASTRDWKLAAYAFDAFKQAGIPTAKRAELVDAMNQARQATFDQAIAEGVDPVQAKVRANYFASRVIEQFFSDIPEGERWASQIVKAAENDAYSMVGRRAEGIKEADEGMLSKPMNWLMEFVTRLRAKGGAASILATTVFGFVNIPFRTTRFWSQYSPYGLLRYGVHEWRRNRGLDTYWKQSFGSELQARARLREAIAGTVVLGLGTAWAANHSTTDDKAGKDKFGLYITGSGPDNKVLKDAWAKAGWQPYSLNFVINGHKVAVPLTRVGEAVMFPFILAAAHDDAQWKLKEAAATGRAAPGAVSNYVGTLIGEIFNMAGQKGVLQGPAKMYELVQGGASWQKAFAKEVGTLASGLFLPYKQLLASISDMFVGPLDQSSATSIIANNFPIIGLPFQQKAVNRFGDQLYDRSWYGRIARTGIPVAFQVFKNPENERLYNGLLLQKGAAPPALLRHTIEERYGPLTNEQFAQFSAISGQNLKQQTLSNADGLQALPPEDVKKALNQAATSANNIAAAQMGLERVKPSTREVAAGPAPAATGQRLPSAVPSLVGATGAVTGSSRISGVGPRRIGLPRAPSGLGRRLSGLGRVGTPRIALGRSGGGRRLVTGRLRSRGGGRVRIPRPGRRRIRLRA